jgi:hypothetical protein
LAAGGINNSKKMKKLGWAGLKPLNSFIPAHPRRPKDTGRSASSLSKLMPSGL